MTEEKEIHSFSGDLEEEAKGLSHWQTVDGSGVEPMAQELFVL